jgi:AcrR family transcriptional regulator
VANETLKPTKASNTRERLLEVALAQFNANGFNQTSMRDLAAAADLSLGAFYYHFKNKEELVQVYYEGTLERFARGSKKIFSESKKFEERLIKTIQFRIKSFQENRDLLVALSRAAVDPRSDLSPFGARQKTIRDQTIAVFSEMIEGSDLKFNKRLQPVLPMLLWMYMMGIIFFWVYDESVNQKKTFQIIEQLTPLICRLIRFSRVPLSGRVISPILNVLNTVLDEPNA